MFINRLENPCNSCSEQSITIIREAGNELLVVADVGLEVEDQLSRADELASEELAIEGLAVVEDVALLRIAGISLGLADTGGVRLLGWLLRLLVAGLLVAGLLVAGFLVAGLLVAGLLGLLNLLGRGDDTVTKSVVDGFEERELLTADTLEVVGLDRPGHHTAEVELVHKTSFLGVGHLLLLVVLDVPVLVEELLADLVVAQHTALLGVGSSTGWAIGGGANSVHMRVGQSEAATVERNTQDELFGWGALLQPVVDHSLLEKICLLMLVLSMTQNSAVDRCIFGRSINAGLLVPETVEVVGHEVDEVQVLGNCSDVIRLAGGTFSSTNGSTEDQTFLVKPLFELFEQLDVGVSGDPRVCGRALFPTTDGNHGLGAWTLLTKSIEAAEAVLAIGKVVPGVEVIDTAVFAKTDEGVDQVGAEGRIDVGDVDLTVSWTVDRPATEVADDLFCGRKNIVVIIE
ncbi:hypothetical protein TSAR_007815 [Trichomalopsis sarcophagae]|uniref:Uncharacterized protein n=1 Tax=Trichomalopsis sarcophagae TaxID=543379 RepID=A0A232FJ45_9HYME|nr:hypothetical protein TSAR_007815 [Trichomalopsis sarcophagae]